MVKTRLFIIGSIKLQEPPTLSTKKAMACARVCVCACVHVCVRACVCTGVDVQTIPWVGLSGYRLGDTGDDGW